MELKLTEAEAFTFTGLAFITTCIVQGLKKVFGEKVERHVKLISVGLCMAIGILGKLTVTDAFTNVGWVYAVIGFFLAGVASLGFYSAFFAPFKKKGQPGSGSGSPTARLLLFALVLGVLVQGCSLFESPNKRLVEAVENYLTPIEQEYRAYVIEGKPRPTFSDPEREKDWIKIRQNTLSGLHKLLDEAK